MAERLLGRSLVLGLITLSLSAATICVVTNDGRAIVVRTSGAQAACSLCCSDQEFYPLQGLLRGYDQATNLILDECHERVFSVKVHAQA